MELSQRQPFLYAHQPGALTGRPEEGSHLLILQIWTEWYEEREGRAII